MPFQGRRKSHMPEIKKLRFVLFIWLTATASICRAIDIKALPEQEKAMLNSTDPWGLAFSDQIARFQTCFGKDGKTDFLIGIQHNLEKIFRNKYWFRGEISGSENGDTVKPLWTATGATASFQVAVLPRTGANDDHYEITVSAPVKTEVYRIEYVKLPASGYPRFSADYWPDPLVPENFADISGTNLAAFLVELKIPRSFDKTLFPCQVTVSNSNGRKVSAVIPVEVVRLKIEPEKYPLVAWFWNNRNLTDLQFREMCLLALSHHLQPLTAPYLQTLWDPGNTGKFDRFFQFLLDNGQEIFEIKKPDGDLYAHLKEKNWLDKCITYSNADEPAEETFAQKNIPYAQEMKEKYPGLKIFLASEYHPQMEKGCDIWLTDLSSSVYDPVNFKIPKKPELWHYYCHLPIRFQMRAPLTLAPNMLIDNAALEHRLALWMSWYYKARGVFIYAGNSWGDIPSDFWQKMDLQAKEYKYPYAGIHNGNGFLVYPPVEKDGKVLPSLRLKILRDGMEDIAIMEAVRKAYGDRTAAKIISPVPDVFMHTHYYDRCPEALLEKMESILKFARGKTK